MKPSTQSLKSSTSSKSKKNSKDRDKRKSQTSNSEINNHNSTDKGSPAKDSSVRQFTGINSESIVVYAEQSAFEHLSEDVTNLLTEDINYRLRYIIHNSLIKARLLGNNAIDSYNLEETFQNLKIDKVYGAPTNPDWIKFFIPHENQFFYCLDDNVVNLIELVEEETVYQQPGEVVLTRKWLPEKEVSKALKNYFTTMCQMIVNKDEDLRKFALLNISENPQIGSIIEWFYNFGYFLLSKDITYDCLTLNALDLIATLENSMTCRINVSEKKLKLLVRLILQRLLKSFTTTEILKPMCSVLAVLCKRAALKEFVILKISQKMPDVCEKFTLLIINCLGIEAIHKIFLPNIEFFLNKIENGVNIECKSCIMETFNIILKNGCMDWIIYNEFYEIFGSDLVMYSRQTNNGIKESQKEEINLVNMRIQLYKTRRRIPPIKSTTKRSVVEEIFMMPLEKSKLRQKLNSHKGDKTNNKKETNIIIGKSSLLLPVLKANKTKQYSKCFDHSLRGYNL